MSMKIFRELGIFPSQNNAFLLKIRREHASSRAIFYTMEITLGVMRRAKDGEEKIRENENPLFCCVRIDAGGLVLFFSGLSTNAYIPSQI